MIMIMIMSKNFVEQLVVMAEGQRALEEDCYLFHRDDPVAFLFAVTKGAVELVRPQRDGKLIVLQRATRHTVLAEASLYSRTYHCDAIAASPSIVVTVPRDLVLKRLAEDGVFSQFWSQHLAKEMMEARYRSEILSRKTVAERLDTWLTWRGEGLPAKGTWKDVAKQIGVSPEALYRELSKRRSHQY